MKGLLIGEAASLTDQQRIAAIEIEPSVTRLIHMRTEHIGPGAAWAPSWSWCTGCRSRTPSRP